jgi:hypothetical protein
VCKIEQPRFDSVLYLANVHLLADESAAMPHRYFHFQNGLTTLDPYGLDVPDMETTRAEAALTVAAVLREDNMKTLWAGTPLRLWVTADPDGKGDPILSVQVTASEPSDPNPPSGDP